MIGYMYYNRFGHAGFTDRNKGRTAASVQTCPVCLLAFDARGGTLPGGTVLEKAEWTAKVCTQIRTTPSTADIRPAALHALIRLLKP
jgi:hypothetical protein